MKREDLRKYIIPTTILNTNLFPNEANESFNTTDFVYLESLEENYDEEKTDIERRTSATDYTQMNNAYIDNRCNTRSGKNSTFVLLRSALDLDAICFIQSDGNWGSEYTRARCRFMSLCALYYYR